MNLYVISHTHWDREWYAPFETYRRRLVHLIDELIEQMEINDDYKFFHLDGQTIVLNDYLEMRPQNKHRLEKLIKDGRIIIGPWYVMPDEFLVSGESLVRNLQKGIKICNSFGVEAMKNGYVTDIFGHNSQFPQILKGFNIEHATLFRGMGAYEKDLFIWESDDGSRVLTFKLDCDRSYSNFYFGIRYPFVGYEKQDHPYEPRAVKRKMQELIEYSKKVAVTDNILMMDGCDHVEIEPQLPEIIKIISEMKDVNIKHATIHEFQEEQQRHAHKCDVIKGELYSVAKKGLNELLLKNVLSSTVHLKQMNDKCERLLTRWVEPFDVLEKIIGYKDDDFNKEFIEKAWDYVLQNHPHDSICGCSISDVHRTNEYRFKHALEIIDAFMKESSKKIVNSINTKSLNGQNAVTIFNLTPNEIKEVALIEIKFFNKSTGCFNLFDEKGNEIEYQIINVEKSVVNMELSTRRLPDQIFEDIYTIAISLNVPLMGFTSYGIHESETIQNDPLKYTYESLAIPKKHNTSMRLSHNSWDNGVLIITVNNNGTLNIIDKKSGKHYNELLIFESSGDIGDGWNYVKPVNDKVLLSNAFESQFAVLSDGPLAVVIQITTEMLIPENYDNMTLKRSSINIKTKVETTITILKDNARIDFKTEIKNEAIDHRLRVMFQTFAKTDSFNATTPFSFVSRKINRPDTIDFKEADTNVSPNQGIITVVDEDGGIGIYNKGLYEVEVTDNIEKSVILTLFRSFRNEYGTTMGRKHGECKNQVGLQQGNQVFEYAIDFIEHSYNALIRGDLYRTGVLCVTKAIHDGLLSATNSFISFKGEKPMVSSFRRQDNKIELRLYNPTAETMLSELFIKDLKGAKEVNFLSETIEEKNIKNDTIEINFEKYKIKTLLFELDE